MPEESRAPTSGPEKRKLKRRQLIYYLKVQSRRSGRVIGRLADITAEGMMLISTTPLDAGDVYYLDIFLPANVKEAAVARVDAECLWTKEDVNPDLFVSGFRFIRVSTRDVDLINELILDYELPS
jgi:hypothetical protein